MPRLSRLIAFGLLLAWAAGVRAQSGGHLRAGNLTRPCMACHKGHGVSGSPVLARSGDALCVPCHTQAARNQATKAALGIGPGANPPDVETDLQKGFTHRGARCLDCHSAHLAVRAASPETGPGSATGLRRGSPKRGFASEAELCLSCHGSRGPRGADVHDLGARLDPTNPSFHPVLAVGRSTSVPSLRAPLGVTSFVNCTDCHGSDSPTSAKGLHGSRVSSILRGAYAKQDGQPESPATYALCYACHDREVVLKRDDFPLHDKHVTGEKTACRICHDAHGVTGARALIRFNEAAVLAEVAPSRSGKIQFLSSSPGSGACYLTCHGKNHDPLGYGTGSTLNGVALVTSDALRPVRAGGLTVPGTKATAPPPGEAVPIGPSDGPRARRVRDPGPVRPARPD